MKADPDPKGFDQPPFNRRPQSMRHQGGRASHPGDRSLFRLLMVCCGLLWLWNPSLRADDGDETETESAASEPEDGGEGRRTRGFSQARSTRDALEEGFAPRRVALVVGGNRYQDPTFPPLKHAIDDARAIASILHNPSQGHFDQVLLLDDPTQTTRVGILAELRRLKLELRRQDTFVFYFSGHGTADPSTASNTNASAAARGGDDADTHYYLVASDTRANRLRETGIELTVLMSYLSELKTQRSVAIFDACFSGDGKSGLSAKARERLASVPNPWARLTQAIERSDAILMATGPGGVAHEDDRLGHGVFTYSLMEALTGQQAQADTNRDGAITPYEVHDFARLLASELSGSSQAPEGFFRVTGRGELYLIGEPDPKRSRQARIYAYGASLQKGLKLSVDGRPRGAFPRTVSVPTGVRMVEVLDGKNHAVARGSLQIEPDETLPLETLIERLKTPRFALELQLGLQSQVLGPAVSVWGAGSPRLTLGGAFRVRGGGLAGAQARLELGWQPIREGLWQQDAGNIRRQRLDVGLELSQSQVLAGERYGILKGTRLGWGGTIRLGYLTDASALLLEDGSQTVEAAVLESAQPYAWVELGPVAWQRIPLQERLALVFREYASVQPSEAKGSLAGLSFRDRLNLQLSFLAGAELGF